MHTMQSLRRLPRGWLALPVLVACATDPGPPDDPGSTQIPPRGADALPWLARGDYLRWRCEPAPHAPRSPSPHGTTRTCVNDALAGAPAGADPYPVGAATVKEAYDGTAIIAYAIARKLSEGAGGGTWYWFESARGQVAASGAGLPGCTGCHAQAARDLVFTAPP